ncbi:unnamed protein product [Vitrella brassicaformis CCMP3155]|uniref:RxLR effector protein n=1 Tax=Vitrella brassicaformis (strain CCMP3155) TaxID=1169540 RepID=A0A0G4EXN4_VITBC|nr:unnamed protein product [Vitrella brassicaformis CCMP3155]|eukprot:CEM03481.1 unnamed protein product [Vitrella brassicaformis CCMP3155]
MMKVLSVLLCVVGITLASADPQPPAVAAAAGAAPSVLARRLRGGTADGANEITTEGVLPETVVRTAVETADDKTEQSSTAEAPVVEPEVKTASEFRELIGGAPVDLESALTAIRTDDRSRMTVDRLRKERISASSGPDAAAADRRRLIIDFLFGKAKRAVGKAKRFVGKVKRDMANVAWNSGAYNLSGFLDKGADKLDKHADKLCGGPC